MTVYTLTPIAFSCRYLLRRGGKGRKSTSLAWSDRHASGVLVSAVAAGAVLLSRFGCRAEIAARVRTSARHGGSTPAGGGDADVRGATHLGESLSAEAPIQVLTGFHLHHRLRESRGSRSDTGRSKARVTPTDPLKPGGDVYPKGPCSP
jgi:hypothetical protein